MSVQTKWSNRVLEEVRERWKLMSKRGGELTINEGCPNHVAFSFFASESFDLEYRRLKSKTSHLRKKVSLLHNVFWSGDFFVTRKGGITLQSEQPSLFLRNYIWPESGRAFQSQTCNVFSACWMKSCSQPWHGSFRSLWPSQCPAALVKGRSRCWEAQWSRIGFTILSSCQWRVRNFPSKATVKRLTTWPPNMKTRRYSLLLIKWFPEETHNSC